jgi:hypothetical protein
LIRNASAKVTKIQRCVDAARCARHGARKHQQRADQRVDDELVGRRHTVRPGAPLADQEVERDQHQVEEEDEEREVLREEGAEHRRLGQREVEREQPWALDRAQEHPQRGGREQERRERDQPQVEAVDPELVADAQRLDPGVVGDVLEPAAGRVVVEEHDHGEGERQERTGQRDRGCEGPEQQDGEVERQLHASTSPPAGSRGPAP